MNSSWKAIKLESFPSALSPGVLVSCLYLLCIRGLNPFLQARERGARTTRRPLSRLHSRCGIDATPPRPRGRWQAPLPSRPPPSGGWIRRRKARGMPKSAASATLPHASAAMTHPTPLRFLPLSHPSCLLVVQPHQRQPSRRQLACQQLALRPLSITLPPPLPAPPRLQLSQ